jgi:AcrR family transcriptional regulator
VTKGPPIAPPRPALRPRTPRSRQIIDTARALLETVGRDGLTMRRLADELGIRAPSLYKHIGGRPALELALVETGLDESGLALHAAVQGSNANPVAGLLGAYRAMGLANPELYRLITASPFPRSQQRGPDRRPVCGCGCRWMGRGTSCEPV